MRIVGFELVIAFDQNEQCVCLLTGCDLGDQLCLFAEEQVRAFPGYFSEIASDVHVQFFVRICVYR